jgi:hypothetical protein
MPDERRAALTVFVVLILVYVASLAPGVTLWDSGEFNAAIASLGIPHPPGTPLYVIVARVWSRALGVLPQAAAVNALSAVATAAGCAVLARLLARWSGSVAGAVAGGLAAGSMLAVWQNATETEVYALSFLLGIIMVALGDRAGRSGLVRDRVMLAYAMALSVPLQISALVAAPAAVLLAATPPGWATDASNAESRWGLSWSVLVVLVVLAGVLALVACLGLVRPSLGVAGAVLMAAAGAMSALAKRQPGAAEGQPIATQAARIGPGEIAALAMVVLVAASATLFMLFRAAHDPAVNQGNPENWASFLDVVARRQYDVPGLWPRRAPLWLQLANLVQYADWQVAFGLDDSVAASWRRTPFTVLFASLAVVGARWHGRRDPRGARATLLLLLSASLGVVLILNLHAGPSFGYGVLPSGAPHEARERDYFFALAFATAGLWAGLGAVVMARRFAGHPRSGLVLAALPIVLNWNAANRRREPDASLARVLGETLLESAPPDALLILSGDNDTYAVWYQQQVRGRRRDVIPVTEPLLGARWYRGELARRRGLLDSVAVSSWYGESATLRRLIDAAAEQGRSVAVSVSLPRALRMALAPSWSLRGAVFVSGASPSEYRPAGWPFDDGIDTARTRAIATRVGDTGIADSAPRDATGRYVQRLLACPHEALEVLELRRRGAIALLDSRCNLK